MYASIVKSSVRDAYIKITKQTNGEVQRSLACDLVEQAKAVAETGIPNVPMLILWGFGVACMTGGVPTMHPCIISYAYGRREYQSANRIILAIQMIPYSFAAMMMITLIGAGKAKLAFGILVVIIVIGIIATCSMLNMKDANYLDRGLGKDAQKGIDEAAL